MSGRVLGGLVWLTGCAQLAGIDNTSGGQTVSLSIDHVSVGTTVERAPEDLTGETAEYLLPTQDRVTAKQVAIDTWTADIFEPTPILFALPDNVLRLWDYPNTALLGSFVVLEHPDAAPVDPASMLAVNATLDVPYSNESFQLFIVGTWNAIAIPAPALGAAAVALGPFPVSMMQSLTGRQPERITTVDTELVLRYVGNALNGFGTVPAFDQTGNDTLATAITTVTADQPIDIRIDPTGAATRFSACRPAVPSIGFSWDVRAVPGPEVNASGPLLNAAGVTMTDTMAQAMYANPFEAQWPALLTWSTAASRTFTPPGQMLAVTLQAGMFQRTQDPQPALILDLPAGLPELISLDNTPLSTDGMTITAPTAPVKVDIVTDRPDGTLFQVELLEIVPDATNTVLQLSPVFAASATTPSLTVPPEVLVPGKTYTLRAITTVGSFPNIANGDLRTRDLPIATAFFDSGVFTVSP